VRPHPARDGSDEANVSVKADYSPERMRRMIMTTNDAAPHAFWACVSDSLLVARVHVADCHFVRRRTESGDWHAFDGVASLAGFAHRLPGYRIALCRYCLVADDAALLRAGAEPAPPRDARRGTCVSAPEFMQLHGRI
jgi:hypothetical protein